MVRQVLLGLGFRTYPEPVGGRIDVADRCLRVGPQPRQNIQERFTRCLALLALRYNVTAVVEFGRYVRLPKDAAELRR